MKSIRNKPYWITGITLALSGVFLARVMVDKVPDSAKLIMLFSGYALALTGMVVISFGTRKIR